MHGVRWTRLHTYLTVVSIVGVPLTFIALLRVPWTNLDSPLPMILVASGLLILGELRPIPVSRGADAGDELSISSTLALALIFLTAPGVAITAQAIALIIDESRSRRRWERLLFNISQYAIAMMVTRIVYADLTGQHLFGHSGSFSADHLPAALAGAVAFFVLNNGLTGIAVSLATRMPVRRLVQADLRSHFLTDGVLLALAPVVAQAMAWSVFALPLLMVPLIAVHRSASLASQREYEALHDALTGLSNRPSLLMRLNQACNDLQSVPVAVMLVDLDHFKEVNDTLGHYVGDRLLVEVANRLRSALREGDFIARLGGDEFAILAYHVDTDAEALDVASRLHAAFESTIPLSGADLAAGCSVGIALAPRHGADEDLLLKRADVALYDAKTTRGSVMVYEDSRDDHSVERLGLVADLRRAIDDGEVFPLFQPLCDTASGEIVSVEALARWRHPTAGLLGPDDFLDIAEGAGLLDTLTDSMLEQCLRQLRTWHRCGRMLRLAINVSPRTMRDSRVVDRIRMALEAADIEARWLTIEVTEHVMVGDAARALATLDRLRRLGCRIAIDDFGTGYSSMAYLKRLPVDELKIDRSFVEKLGEEPKDEIIVRAVVDLAHRFGLEVTAEGVETEPAWALLAAIGCDVIQGYLLSRPLTADALSAWLDLRVPASRPVARPALKAL